MMSVLLTEADEMIVERLQTVFADSAEAGWDLLNGGVCTDGSQYQRVLDELVERRVLFLCDYVLFIVVSDEAEHASICHGCGEVDKRCTCADDHDYFIEEDPHYRTLVLVPTGSY